MRFQAYAYLPDYQNSEDPLAVKLMMSLPLIGMQIWALAVGILYGVQYGTIFGIIVGLLATCTFHIRFADLHPSMEFMSFIGLVFVGVLSAASVCAVGSNPLLIALCWWATGTFNVRFYNWFFGPPQVFENRALSESVTFLMGPLYWGIVAIVIVILFVGSAVSGMRRVASRHR